MSRFVSNRLKRIDLGEDEWIELPEEISFQEYTEIKSVTDEVAMSKKMFTTMIRAWNLKDEDWKELPVTEANIMRLNIDTVTIITEELTKLVQTSNHDKKKLETSSSPSAEHEAIQP